MIFDILCYIDTIHIEIYTIFIESLMENLQLFTNNSHKNQINYKVAQTLDNLFPEREKENRDISEAREILGLFSKEFDDQQIKDLIVEVQFLTESWLDDFERSIFNGLTLQELFHEKGGL